MEAASASGSASTVSDGDNFVISYEDSSCPVETDVELALSLGLKGPRISRVSCAEVCSSFSSSSSSPSLTRASATAGIKRTADSMAATNGQVVGWPPIRTHRMNNMVNQVKTLATGELNLETQKNRKSDGRMRHSMFVKVAMDGIPIGRKIDLNAHRSYASLLKTLEDMFKKPLESPGGSSGFVLTYEDKERDWMLVGDVPWDVFLESVRRLRIMRREEATGTG